MKNNPLYFDKRKAKKVELIAAGLGLLFCGLAIGYATGFTKGRIGEDPRE